MLMMNNKMKEKYEHLQKGCKVPMQQFSISHFATFSNTAETG